MKDAGHTLKLTLLIALGILSAIYIFWWRRIARAQRAETQTTLRPSLAHLALGFGTNFFDTLGIGSFATTTTAFKLLRMVRDEFIPGTLIAGHALPVMAQAIIFMTVVKVDPVLLVLTIVAMVGGGWIGAGVVAGLPKRWIQVGMGFALLLAATSLLMSQFGLFPAGGTATGLPPARMLIAVGMYSVFGMLCTLGIGHYAPSLVLFSLLGLDLHAAFPIMAGAGAFAGIVASTRFLLLAPLQFSERLRRRFTGTHRIVGRLYVVSAILLSLLGAYIQYYNERLGFPRSFTVLAMVNAVMLIVATAFAFLFAYRRKITQHRQWMTRSYAIALVFIEVRFIMGITGWEQLGGEIVQAIIWSCMAMALLLAEIANHWTEIRSVFSSPAKSKAAKQSVSGGVVEAA